MSTHEFWRQMIFLFLVLVLITCQLGAVVDASLMHRLWFAMGGMVAGMAVGYADAKYN